MLVSFILSLLAMLVDSDYDFLVTVADHAAGAGWANGHDFYSVVEDSASILSPADFHYLRTTVQSYPQDAQYAALLKYSGNLIASAMTRQSVAIYNATVAKPHFSEVRVSYNLDADHNRITFGPDTVRAMVAAFSR